MQLYEVGKLIGTGSSGDVFLCRHIKEKEYNYAVKKIKMMQIQEKERQNIENQLKLLQKLRHPNIVSYKDSFTDRDGNLCIVMVYCETGDMHTKIKQTKEKGKYFTEAQILDWLTQTALAIYYLHHQKILHRDLKTQNLFLKKERDADIKKEDKKEKEKEDERIRLGDFGISKVLDTTQDLARTCIGTPYYMAPQVFRYKPYSYKSDIWSLGVIAYQMCNLRLPFQGQHYNALAMKVMKGTFPSITPTYSKQLRDLITNMLHKNTQDRPSIIDILNKPFIRTRCEKYMNDMFMRNVAIVDNDDIYLDTLKEQAINLQFTVNGIVINQNSINQHEDTLKKYPSSKDLEKKYVRNMVSRKTQEEENELMKEYHSKRKSTFQRDSHSTDKYLKKSEETSSSFKGLNLGYDFSDEKEAFVDHKRTIMMEREHQKRNSSNNFEYNKRLNSTSMMNMNSNEDQPTNTSQKYKESNRRFKIYEEYTMEEENQLSHLIEPIEEEIINEESDEESNLIENQLDNLLTEEEDEVAPENYNKSYYKLLDQVKVLKHRCENAIGGNKYLRAYNAVNNGCNKTTILDILGQEMIGYWHLIDQIMFNQSILRTLSKY